MMELNKAGSEAMTAAHVHAATDVTGFGLAGHLHEMLDASDASAELVWDDLPLFEGVYRYSCDFCRPAKTFGIIDWARAFVRQGGLGDEEFENRMGVLCDPQTSGGLLVAVCLLYTSRSPSGRRARAPMRSSPSARRGRRSRTS